MFAIRKCETKKYPDLFVIQVDEADFADYDYANTILTM
jgi:hypothetical protein